MTAGVTAEQLEANASGGQANHLRRSARVFAAKYGASERNGAEPARKRCDHSWLAPKDPPDPISVNCRREESDNSRVKFTVR